MLSEVKSVINRVISKQREKIWLSPIAACASAEDPLFEELKKVVAPDHALPQDLLPEARSVIVYFLPFQHEICSDNAGYFPIASRKWAEAYVITNHLITEINERLKEFFKKFGYTSSTTPATHNFDEKRLVSRWSHKHVGYIAGLGTFGINRLLITISGCCGRLGSIITEATIEPTKRPDKEYCLEKSGQSCLKCVRRCPVEALSGRQFDRQSCYKRLLDNDKLYPDLPLTDVCGQCSCNVPCSHTAPAIQSVSELTLDDQARR